ncbi:unnamed protein product [Rhodiola kirilowii]
MILLIICAAGKALGKVLMEDMYAPDPLPPYRSISKGE